MALSDTLDILQSLGNTAMACVDTASANAAGADAEKYADAASAAWDEYRAALKPAEQEHPEVCFACDIPAALCPCRD